MGWRVSRYPVAARASDAPAVPSTWFARAVAGAGGIVVPGWPDGDAADLSVGCDGVELRVGTAVARLPWERFWSPWPVPPLAWAWRGVIPPRTGWPYPFPCRSWDVAVPDGWSIGPYGTIGHYPEGIAVIGRDASATAMAPVVAAIDSPQNRLRRFDDEDGAVALWATAPGGRHEVHVLAALATALAQRPELRPGLARRQVGARLAADIAQCTLRTVHAGDEFRPMTKSVVGSLGERLEHVEVGVEPIDHAQLGGDPSGRYRATRNCTSPPYSGRSLRPRQDSNLWPTA